MLGTAKAEEALVGIPKPDAPDQTVGSLDRALELYQQAADKCGDSFEGKEAAERAKDIRENKQKILAFYQDLNKGYSTKPDVKIPDPFQQPDLPGLPNPHLPAPNQPAEPIKPVVPAATTPTQPNATTPRSTEPSIKPVETPKTNPTPPKTEPTAPAATAPKTETKPPAATTPKTEPTKPK